jgi:hypothetical protein
MVAWYIMAGACVCRGILASWSGIESKRDHGKEQGLSVPFDLRHKVFDILSDTFSWCCLLYFSKLIEFHFTVSYKRNH